MAVSEPPQRDLEGEEGERQREGEGEEESRGEEMEESQSAAVSVVEAMGVEELSTPMEEGPPGSTGSVQPGSGGDDEASALLSTPHVQEQPQQDSAASPVPSPGQSKYPYALHVYMYNNSVCRERNLVISSIHTNILFVHSQT